MKRISEKLARFIERHPLWFIVIAVVLSAASVPGITMLKTETGFSALVSPEAEISMDNARYQTQFGGEQVNILLTGDMDDIFSTGNLAALATLETEIYQDPRYRSITSPLTVLKAAVEEAALTAQVLRQQLTEAQEKAAEEARKAAAASGLNEQQQELAAEQARALVLTKLQPRAAALLNIGEPSLENPLFVRYLLYTENGEISQPMKQFVPGSRHVLAFVTPEGNMTDAVALEATRHIETVIGESGFSGIEVSVISATELVDAISVGMSENFKLLLGLSVLAMIIILMVLFRVRWRLLSLLMVGISSLWTFGLMGYLSVPLTMASMAVLPILIGLGIDFSIQFHNRYQEELTRNPGVSEAIVTSISRMFPVVGIALFATIIGFITLFISEVPMIRDFGMMLAVGIVISYLVGLFLLHSIVYMVDRNVPVEKLRTAASKASSRIERVLLRLGRLAINHTLWIFIIALLFAAGGAWVDRFIQTNTDYEQLMPQDNESLMELRNLREIVGAGGSIKFMVEAQDVASPEVLRWMRDYQAEAVMTHPEILSAASPATLVSTAAGGTIPSTEQINAILAGTPSSYREQLISADRTMASLSFTIRHISFEEIYNLIQELKKSASPPAGVKIAPVGSIVLGAHTMDAVVGSRMAMNLICITAIFIILLLVYRRLDKTVFTVLPVGAVIAWSSLDMYLAGIPLNPLTAILGVIVIGICTEFMVLLTGRYEEEKGYGTPPKEAMATAISKIGRAITTTAMTTLGGFGVLIVSDFVMIKQFGIATLLGVFLCLIITITVMPGVIVWYDNLRLKRAEKQKV